MTDQTIPADKVKKVADWLWEDILANGGMDEEVAPQLAARTEMAEEVRRLLLALLPKRPTLADMSVEERAACQWMQADVKGEESRVVIIVYELSEGRAALLDRWGNVTYEKHGRITPRPDLPRLEWPGTEKPAPAPALPGGWRLADHEKHGRVIVTNDTPNTVGHVCFVLPATDPMGYDWLYCDPSELRYLDTTSAVQPNTMAVGSVWGDADALTAACREFGSDQVVVTDKDGDVSMWGAYAGWWVTGHPGYDFGPYTIIHAGRKTCQ